MAETFLQAFRGRDRYDPTLAGVRPWLYGIATNLIGRQRRAEVRFYRAIARTGVDPAVESPMESVTDRLSAEGMRGDLARAPARLNAGERDVLVLVSAGGLAQALGTAHTAGRDLTRSFTIGAANITVANASTSRPTAST